MKKEERQLIEAFFDEFSPVHALVRANEAMFLKRVKMRKPILDLGCGDGRFALLTYGEKYIDVGLDADPKEVRKAIKSKAYKSVVVARGAKMPFVKETFKTIISNSVLEHVDELDKVLKETVRILDKKGFFFITVPTPLISKYFFWSKFIPGWAGFKNKVWKHINFFGEEIWRSKLEKAGFRLVKIEKTNSKGAILWADILLPIFPLGPMKRFLPFLEKRRIFGTHKDGATLLICAEKK